ncbi:ion transporter [Mycolicibacterium chlorophenolicum]|uniref:ion transporter n=1 Tax=Mycolicibacterium chlorophenolicum TaxID=37916 RepID=UPI000653B16F|nr:ion transporter [Mycolicibacterium chlorophenolicum]
MTAAIVANAGVFVWGLIDHHHERLAETIEHGILALFIVELVVTMAVQRAAFWRNPWHVFDVVVIAASLLPLLPGAAVLRVARLAKTAKLLHLARHTVQLRTGELMPRR